MFNIMVCFSRPGLNSRAVIVLRITDIRNWVGPRQKISGTTGIPYGNDLAKVRNLRKVWFLLPGMDIPVD